MKRRTIAILAFSLLWSGSWPVVASAQAADAPPTIRQFDLDTIRRLGRQMYEQDQAVWHSTDMLLTLVPEKDREKLAGWVVTKSPEKDTVRYLVRTKDGVEAAYEFYFWPNDPNPRLTGPTTPKLSEDEMARYRAGRAAIAAFRGPLCAESVNTIVLPDPDSKNWLVWLIQASSKREVVVGGHTRFTVSADGATVLRTDQLSRGCLNLPLESDGPGQLITGYVSPQPLETHVFLSLTFKTRFFVHTFDPDGAWKVQGDEIVSIPVKPGQPAPAAVLDYLNATEPGARPKN